MKNLTGPSPHKADEFELVTLGQDPFPPGFPGKDFHVQFRHEVASGQSQMIGGSLDRRGRRKLPFFTVQ